MRIRRLFPAVSLLALLAIALPACGEPYFPAASVPPTVLPPPPSVRGDIWLKDIEAMRDIQRTADPAEVEEARAERNYRPEMVVEFVDPGITREAYPALYAMLDRIDDTGSGISRQAKYYWNTRRPYVEEPGISALINAHSNPAYPSGHTTDSYLTAYVMGLLAPEKRAAFRARAEEISQHRVLVGMHYPHDLQGGRELASLVFGGLLQNPEFQSDLARVKEELARTAR